MYLGNFILGICSPCSQDRFYIDKPSASTKEVWDPTRPGHMYLYPMYVNEPSDLIHTFGSLEAEAVNNSISIASEKSQGSVLDQSLPCVSAQDTA